MNESGKSVQALLSWFKLAPGQLVVVHDELDIPPGRNPLQAGAEMPATTALRSIEQYIGSNAYYRLRIGIGKPAHKGKRWAGFWAARPGRNRQYFRMPFIIP